MALTLRCWWWRVEFRRSFFEVSGLGASRVGFTGERAVGAVGKFVLGRVGQRGAILVAPNEVGGLVQRKIRNVVQVRLKLRRRGGS